MVNLCCTKAFFFFLSDDSKLKILRLLSSEIYWMKGNYCCFTDCMKKIQHCYAFGHLQNNLAQTWYDDRYC